MKKFKEIVTNTTVSDGDLGKEKNRPYITAENIRKAEKEQIPGGSIILIGAGWGRYWGKSNFLRDAWFFRKDALEYLVSKKPFIIGGDTPTLK